MSTESESSVGYVNQGSDASSTGGITEPLVGKSVRNDSVIFDRQTPWITRRTLTIGAGVVIALVVVIVIVIISTASLSGSDGDKFSPYELGVGTAGNTTIFVAGSGRTAVLLVPDINGMWSGYAVQLAQYYAGNSSFTIILMDEFSGQPPDVNYPIQLANATAARVVDDILARGYTSVHVIGYCYGGRIVAYLTSLGRVTTGVFAHPSSLQLSMAQSIVRPVLFTLSTSEGPNGLDINTVVPYQEVLNANKIPQVAVNYNHTGHGFACNYPRDQYWGAGKSGAMRDSLAFFNKYI